MKNYTPNYITVDVRNLLPRDSKPLSPNELTKNIDYDQFITKAEEINQLNLMDNAQLDNDLSSILLVDDHNLKGIALGCLTGIHTFNGNYKKAIACSNQALNLNVNNEVNAYILTEYANLLRQFGRIDEALAILDSTYKITKNEELKWRIITIKGYSYRRINKEFSLNYLNDVGNFYLQNNDFAKYSTVKRHIGITYSYYGDYVKAKSAFLEVKELAKSHSMKTMFDIADSEIAWLLVEDKQYLEASKIFKNLIYDDLIPYTKCNNLQNLAHIEFVQENYESAIEYQKKSLEISKKFEILELLFEDYYKLGISYEKIGQYSEAEYYYVEGFKQLQNERNELGIILLSGSRGLLLDNYIRFTSIKPPIMHVGQFNKTFHFINGKQYKEILDIFQKHVLTLHRLKTGTIKEICNNLNISMRLYFVYQKRYSITKDKNIIQNIDNEHFKHYVYSLANLEWRTAVKQFDSDLYLFLLDKYQYNKSKIAEVLNVSLLTVIKKTANISK